MWNNRALCKENMPRRTFPVDLLNCGLEAVPEYHVVRIRHVSELAHVTMVCREVLGTFARQTDHCGRFINNDETGGRYAFEE